MCLSLKNILFIFLIQIILRSPGKKSKLFYNSFKNNSAIIVMLYHITLIIL